VPTLIFTEMIAYDELGIWLKNKNNKKCAFLMVKVER
jgi:hypothetical protein